jgi:predicted transcriptional regulator
MARLHEEIVAARLSVEEREAIRRIAAAEDRSVSNVIRRAIRREIARKDTTPQRRA